MTVLPEIVPSQATVADTPPIVRPAHAVARLSPFRCQPPVYSPVPRSAVSAAARDATACTADPRARLAELLLHDYAADHAILCASGTTALQLAIRAALAELGAETPVALPAFSCYDVATAAVGAGASIALYDIDPGTLGPDLDSLNAVLRTGVRVVVVAHLFGMPVDWDTIDRLAAAHGAVVIEDAAQGHGARLNGRPLGGLGAISILSFGRGKGWTGGAGGALLLRSARAPIEVNASQLPRLGRATGDAAPKLRIWAQWAFGRPALYGLPASIPWLGLGETRYHEPAVPRGISRFSAALLMHGRPAAEREAGMRRRNGEALATGVAGFRDLAPVRIAGEGASPGFLRLPIRVRGGIAAAPARDRLIRLGVAQSYPKPIALLSQIAGRIVVPDRRFAGAETLARDLITVATHSLLTDGDRQRVLRLLDTRGAREA